MMIYTKLNIIEKFIEKNLDTIIPTNILDLINEYDNKGKCNLDILKFENNIEYEKYFDDFVKNIKKILLENITYEFSDMGIGGSGLSPRQWSRFTGDFYEISDKLGFNFSLTNDFEICAQTICEVMDIHTLSPQRVSEIMYSIVEDGLSEIFDDHLYFNCKNCNEYECREHNQ